jgi:hypothetical protein
VPIRPLRVWAGLLLILACSPGPQPSATRLSVSSVPPASSLLRLPVAGGRATLYHLPDLRPWAWDSPDTLPALQAALGTDLAASLVYLVSRRGEVISFDLQTARARRDRFAGGANATLGPDGTLYTVNDSLVVTQYIRRTPKRFPTRLAALPRDLFGGRAYSLVAISTGDTARMTFLRPGSETVTAALPSGDASATLWGELIAVAADSAVYLVDPQSPKQETVIRTTGHARAVVFSPSGHRFYVARREGPLLVFNRFTGELIGEIELPGAAASLRMDPFGRWLLVHPAGQDSVWVVNLAANRIAGGVATDWSQDIPTVTNGEVLLVRSGGALLAHDLARPGFPRTGSVAGAGRDLWLPLEWAPGAGADDQPVVAAAEPPAGAPPSPSATDGVFLQVSSSQNPEWSRQLARQLEQQGLPAQVVAPANEEEGYRVVLGPFPSREVAESAGRRLGRPFFIYQPDR